jgi:hypothetical protein
MRKEGSNDNFKETGSYMHLMQLRSCIKCCVVVSSKHVQNVKGARLPPRYILLIVAAALSYLLQVLRIT